jgi:hypothetical protein
VHDLLAVTAEAARALVGVLAGRRTVTRTVRVPLLAGDAASGVPPVERATAGGATAFMHRPVDVVRAVADRGWPGHVRGRVGFTLLDPVLTANTGPWELEPADGAGELRRPDREPGLSKDPRPPQPSQARAEPSGRGRVMRAWCPARTTRPGSTCSRPARGPSCSTPSRPVERGAPG